jgi:hypothetical protein
MVLTYQKFDDAIQACYTLKDAIYEERNLSGTRKNMEFMKNGLLICQFY